MEAAELDQPAGAQLKRGGGVHRDANGHHGQSEFMASKKQPRKTRAKAPKGNWVENVLETWADAAGRNNGDPMKLDDAPEWVLNAYVEGLKVIFPGGLPPREKWDAEFVGSFLGRMNGLERLYAGEVPLGPETEADLEKVKSVAEKQPPPKNFQTFWTKFERNMKTHFKATREAIPVATAAAGASTYDDAVGFQKGLMRGMEIKPDDLATSHTFQANTRTYWVLALMWRTWVKCKSLREVHRHLCKAVGEQKIGNFKKFEKLCRKIGFRIKGRGRPSGKK